MSYAPGSTDPYAFEPQRPEGWTPKEEKRVLKALRKLFKSRTSLAEGELEEVMKEHGECWVVRLSTHGGKTFVILGDGRHTSEDKNHEWVDQDGKKQDWYYIEWKTIASGSTPNEVIHSAEKYWKVCKMTMEEYLQSTLFDGSPD